MLPWTRRFVKCILRAILSITCFCNLQNCILRCYHKWSLLIIFVLQDHSWRSEAALISHKKTSVVCDIGWSAMWNETLQTVYNLQTWSSRCFYLFQFAVVWYLVVLVFVSTSSNTIFTITRLWNFFEAMQKISLLQRNQFFKTNQIRRASLHHSNLHILENISKGT